jgi:hypothetical protein
MPIEVRESRSGRAGYAGFEFSGKIVSWLDEFERWFKEDTRDKPADIPIEDYVCFLVVLYSHYGKLAVAHKEGWGKHIEIIDSFYPRELYPQGQRPGDSGFNVNNLTLNSRLFYLLDFFAEAFPADFMKWYQQQARDYARNFLWLK